MADRPAAPQADAARHADTIRTALKEAAAEHLRHHQLLPEWSGKSAAALDALVAQAAAAEQERDETNRLRRCLVREEEIGDSLTARADAAEQDVRTAMGAAERFREQGMKDAARADRLEQALREIVEEYPLGSHGSVMGRIQRSALAALASPAPDRTEAEA